VPYLNNRIKRTASVLDKTVFKDEAELKRNPDRLLLREILINQKAIMNRIVAFDNEGL